MSKMTKLSIRNFAQIAEAKLSLGDLTVLVGAQGIGKSLALQWLKVAMDGKQVVSQLQQAGHRADHTTLIDLIFGVGMGSAWRKESEVTFDGTRISPKSIGRRGLRKERVFFIPAHRSMLISDGWAAPFQKLTPDTPVVARIFSQNLFDLFNARDSDKLFPLKRVLKEVYRDLINQAVFHDGTVALEQDPQQQARRLRLTHGDARLPFMTWSAGQREFTPLLLGLYHLLPSRRMNKQEDIDWVIIEEPEMGLHPQAISIVLLLVLELLSRDYRVVLSTHSPQVLSAIWMLQRLKEHKARWQLVCEAFAGHATPSLQKVAEIALKKDYRVHLLAYESVDRKVHSKDISRLDPESEDEGESGWGGLTGFSSRFGDSLRQAVNEKK